jgi:hypothetical protein
VIAIVNQTGADKIRMGVAIKQGVIIVNFIFFASRPHILKWSVPLVIFPVLYLLH